jgi:hypothetical protein
MGAVILCIVGFNVLGEIIWLAPPSTKTVIGVTSPSKGTGQTAVLPES